MNSNNANTTDTSQPGSRTGGNINQKLRGFTEVVHGSGDNIRGRFMDVIDSVTGTSTGQHPETDQGRLEVERGMARLTGGPGAAHALHSRRDAPGSSHPDAPRSGSQSYHAAAPQSGAVPPSTGPAGGFVGPDGTIAQTPNQPSQHQYAGGRATHGHDERGQSQSDYRGNDRDFAYRREGPPPSTMGQQGSTPGPAPDRNYGGVPRQLP